MTEDRPPVTGSVVSPRRNACERGGEFDSIDRRPDSDATDGRIPSRAEPGWGGSSRLSRAYACRSSAEPPDEVHSPQSLSGESSRRQGGSSDHFRHGEWTNRSCVPPLIAPSARVGRPSDARGLTKRGNPHRSPRVGFCPHPRGPHTYLLWQQLSGPLREFRHGPPVALVDLLREPPRLESLHGAALHQERLTVERAVGGREVRHERRDVARVPHVELGRVLRAP